MQFVTIIQHLFKMCGTVMEDDGIDNLPIEYHAAFSSEAAELKYRQFHPEVTHIHTQLMGQVYDTIPHSVLVALALPSKPQNIAKVVAALEQPSSPPLLT